jgi:octaprenyl-diphosphate synthase
MHAAAELVPALDAGLLRVVEVFDRQLRSEVEPVSALVAHVESYRGKLLRPMLVLLSGLAAGSEERGRTITDEHVAVAAVIEMVHMATLVHDDVLDEADIRRKHTTINRLAGNEAAVILGDYLLASAYHLCATLPTTRAAQAVGRASMITASGELLQLHHRGNFSLGEGEYFEIIRGKTAELIATACELGAVASGAPRAACEALATFGQCIGMAFQIQDDILDLTGDPAVVGKSLGKDLEKGKLTLPIILYLAGMDAREHVCGVAELRRVAMPAPDPDALAALCSKLGTSGAIDLSRERARVLVERAKDAIGVLGETPARAALFFIADAVIDRQA